ncbi:dedicator of cytokinesis protein 1-like isoform X2 [Liolophura sinensis]|uniref:dedicator of cytokinesis protein 1-like isoform X2 n=1 Tax=Liolophura sinensis TaxID=3198878 RepID=UPI0031598BC9
MTRWCPTDGRTKYGVAICNFKSRDQHCLTLSVGDTVHILEQSDDWFRGYCFRNKALKGIFPRCYIHIKEASVTVESSQECIHPKEPPIVQEISSVLREWSSMWKQLFVVRRKKDFEKIRDMMHSLINSRRLILSRKLTNEEVRDLQQKVTTEIDLGNVLLELDLVVRDDKSNILDPEKSSAIEVYRQHVEATERVQTERVSDEQDFEEETVQKSRTESESEQKIVWRSTYNLYVTVRNFVCRVGEESELLMTLYDVKQSKFISENYVVRWGTKGMPKDLDKLNNLRVLFTDLGPKDRLREKVYLVCQVIRLGVMDPKDIENKKLTQGLRRPFGVAAMDVTSYIQGAEDTDEDKQHFIPFFQCGEKESLEGVIKKVLGGKEVNHKGQGLWVSMEILQGDIKQVREENPQLFLGSTAVARKMGFPEVIMPGDVRNDIYVTLLGGEFNKYSKTSDKNVEVTMHVCNHKGEILENVISLGAGERLISEYKSVIYYHEDKPRWHETVKVAISIEEEFRGLHLKFMYKHRSSTEAKDRQEKVFGMSFVKLMNENGTTLGDTDHEILVYKIEAKKLDPSKYLDLPTTRDDLENRGYLQSGSGKLVVQGGGLTLSLRDSIQISSLVCSTKLTHNVDLLGLLKWQEIINHKKLLKSHLDSIMKVDGEEIVKFLQDLLDSLFSIMMQTTSEAFDNLVFDGLVHIIALISDRKYHQFRRVLDAYIETNFSFAMAYNKLLVIFKFYIDNANEKAQQDSLLKAMKSIEYIIKFIIRSRLLFSAINEGRGKQQFEISMKQLLQSINGMMLFKEDNTLLVQGAALKYMCSTVSLVMTVFDPLELSHLLVDFIDNVLVDFIDNVPRDRLTHQKMTCVDDLVHTELFKLADCRAVLLPKMLQMTKELMERDEESELCARILSDIMHHLHSPQTSPHDSDIEIVMLQILRTVIQTVIATDRCSSLTGHYVAIMISILRQMTESHYNTYVNNFATQIDLLDFLIEILMLFQDLVGKDGVYKSDWREMTLLQNSVILKSLRLFAATIKEKFFSPFEQQLWSNFFHCAISFLTQEALQLENFSSSKRQKIISRYKDMRREMGFEIRAMWFSLGPNRILFIPEMVGPFLEMTLIPEIELRKATIPMFFDMMHVEFTQPVPNSNRLQGNFHQVENEVITQLDALVEGGRGDQQYMELVYDILHMLCEKHTDIKELREQGLAFVEMIKNLLQRLMEYRHIILDENKEHRMSCIVNLLNFYHNIGRQQMYIRYLNKLCDLHLSCDNYTEAAFTLMLYSKLLQWTEEPLHPMLISKKYPSITCNQALKEQLYYDMIDFFDKGKMFEKGIEMCKELVKLYETEQFDYQKLSDVLRKQAGFYDCILRQMRPDPEYFRVGYYGRGFPSFLQNKVFIYRGKEYERLSDFNARLQNLFPNAQLMRTLSAPGEDILQSPNQYLQINAVSPIMQDKERFANKKVSEQILKYYTVNDVQKFTYSRPIQEDSNDITTLYLERTNLLTEYPLPGILRWFQVTSTETFQVTPLENAIETIDGKNKALQSMLSQHKVDPSLRIDPLGLTLNGVVDPSVNGGITKYKVFYTEDYLKRNATEKDFELVMKLKSTTLQQIKLVQEGLKLHRRKAPESLRPFHNHMESRFRELCKILEKDYGIHISKVNESGNVSLKRNQSMPSSTYITGTVTRHSDIGVQSVPGTPENISMLNKTPPSSGRVQSVWVKPDPQRSPAKGSLIPTKVGNIIRRASHVSDSLRGSGALTEQPIELSQQLTPKRPPRPENDKRGSRGSAHFRDQPLSLLNNMNSSSTSLASSASNASTTTVSDFEETEIVEEPPPLPEKASYADYTNVSSEIPPIPQRISPLRPNQKKDKAPPPLPVQEEEENGPPALPQKTIH